MCHFEFIEPKDEPTTEHNQVRQQTTNNHRRKSNQTNKPQQRSSAVNVV
jgi:hypothetical protein